MVLQHCRVCHCKALCASEPGAQAMLRKAASALAAASRRSADALAKVDRLGCAPHSAQLQVIQTQQRRPERADVLDSWLSLQVAGAIRRASEAPIAGAVRPAGLPAQPGRASQARAPQAPAQPVQSSPQAMRRLRSRRQQQLEQALHSQRSRQLLAARS